MLRSEIRIWWTRSTRMLTGAAGTGVFAVAGALRNRWLAQHLDTAGIGILAQVMSVQTWIGTAAGLGLSLSVARAVSASRGENREAAPRAFWAAMTIAAATGGAAAVAGLVAAADISRLVLGTTEYAGLIRISMLGAAGMALWTPLQGFFAGRSDVRAGLTFALAGGGGAALLAFLLVPRFGLAGAAVAGALLYPLGLVGAAVFHAPAHAEAILPRPRPLGTAVSAEAGGLLRVAGVALALSLLDQGTMVALRVHYLKANGPAANGLLQAALALAQQVGAVFYAYLGGYAFGKISGLTGAGPIRDYTRRHFAPLFVLAVAAMALATAGSTPLLRLLYSHRFDAARPLMALALWGELGRVAVQIAALGALALGGTRLWLAIAVSQPILLSAAYAYFVARGAGEQSLPSAYATAAWATLLVALALLARRGVTLDGRALLLLVAGCALLGLLAWLIVSASTG